MTLQKIKKNLYSHVFWAILTAFIAGFYTCKLAKFDFSQDLVVFPLIAFISFIIYLVSLIKAISQLKFEKENEEA